MFSYFNGVITYSPGRYYCGPERYYCGPGRSNNGPGTFKPLKNGTKNGMAHGPFRKNSLITRARYRALTVNFVFRLNLKFYKNIF